ncbi:MAG: U32 family peptidase [Clostridiales bacterium]|nr:U32 family peptidase [Clostridiales bacterium]
MKILSPAGNLESLKMAIYNGADEVYLGINDFNARNNIEGFTLETLKPSVDFAHIYGVKVHLAINILFSSTELQKALDVVCSCLNMGVDAFIVQDLGLISLINKLYPQAEIHLSTQMGIHNLEGILALKDYKFKRVVLSRETPLQEIKRIKENTDIEIEYFVQGALCVSFSGNCYMSSYLFSASGNRGKCKQLCRLPFTLKKQGKILKKGYLLSAKDFNMISRLDDLKNAGVDAIKIEGRARRPEYVALATREYYNAMNGVDTNLDNLKLAFNRNYTEGYFNGNGAIISDIQNHIGIKVGKVEKVETGKRFNRVIFSSNRPLYPKSTFKFFYNKKETIVTAYDLVSLSVDTYALTTTSKVQAQSDVHLIIDQNLEEKACSFVKKRSVQIDIYAVKNQPIKAVAELDGQYIEVSGQVLLESLNRPLERDEIISNFAKSEFYKGEITIKQLENVFITKQNLNEFRRQVFEKVTEFLTRAPISVEPKKLPSLPIINPIKNFEIVRDINEDFNQEIVIFSPEFYKTDDVRNFVDKCQKLGKKAYLDTPNFALEKDIKFLKDIISSCKIGIVANNYYALNLTDDVIIGGGLNVYNHFTANQLKYPFFTAEGELGQRQNYYYMTLRHCPMKNLLNSSCEKCLYQEGYEYVLDSGKTFKLSRKKLSDCTFYLSD